MKILEAEYPSEPTNILLEEQHDDLQKMLEQLTRKLQTSSLICTSTGFEPISAIETLEL
jgi:hypothetical protein